MMVLVTLCKAAAILAAPLMVYADVVKCDRGAVNCRTKAFSGDAVIDCAGAGRCDATKFFDDVKVTCKDSCWEANFFDRTEVLCATDGACSRIFAHDDSVVRCQESGSCSSIAGYGRSRIECVGLDACRGAVFFDTAVVECTGTRSCIEWGKEALVPSVCAAGEYGFPNEGSLQENLNPCHACPGTTVGKPFPGRGDMAERCTCPRGQKMINGACVAVETNHYKCTPYRNTSTFCDKKAFTNGETVDCSSKACYETKFENATALCTEFNACTSATLSRAHCIGYRSCAHTRTFDKGFVTCTGEKTCYSATFGGEQVAQCEGPNSCADARFLVQSEARCTGENACRDTSNPDQLIPTVCPGSQYGFPNRYQTGEGCQPCPNGQVGREFPGRGNIDSRCK